MEASKTLRVLHLEDEKEHFFRVQKVLEASRIQCDLVQVETREDYMGNLNRNDFDLILADLTVPSFDGSEALELARKRHPDTPFIFVSGTMGEETAVEALKAGATDYVLKTNLEKLPYSIHRALREVQQKREQDRVEASLRFTEIQLQHSQKMEAMGRLAGGVAHDFNNLLTIILGYGHALLTELKVKGFHKEAIDEILVAGQRATSLTKQLLAFSKKQVLEPQVLNPNSIVMNTEKMLRRIIGEDITLTLRLADDIKRIKIDAGQMEQVLINLAVNARDAMPQGGHLTIESRQVEIQDKTTERIGVQPGPYVALSVADTGCGMDEATRSRLFEPFFTTKETGKGTGLGLAMAYGIIRQSGGFIEVKSEVNKGSLFTVFLPVTTEAPKPVVHKKTTKIQPRGNETILLVEDDRHVRKMLVGILRKHGYKVLQAKNGVEGKKIFEQNSKRIKLVVTDLVMPQIGGARLAEQIKSMHPNIKIIFMSGYSDGALTRQGSIKDGDVFLQKPVLPPAFLTRVRKILDQAA